MNFRNISAWSIRNPVIPIVIFVGMMLAGLVSFQLIDVQNDPDIEFPVVIVSISQPGAAPTEIETQITQRVEAAVQGLDGVDSISSTTREGRSQTVIQFDIGESIDQAVNDVKNAVDQERSNLPDGILEPLITKESTSGNPIAYFAVGAEDMTMEQLSWFVDDTVAKTLLTINGIGTVERGGGVDREIRVVLIPERIQALGVTASQINSALRQLNLNAAGGQTEIAGSRQSVRVLGNAKTAFDLSQTQIATGDGRSVKLSDIANVSDSFSELSRIARVKGKQVVTFSLSRAKGASDVTVYDDAVKKMEQIAEENPGVSFTQLFTSVGFTKAQYRSSMAAMIEGAVLAIIVVFLFLRDWRATFISAIAIPLSAIPTFWFLDMIGFSLNQMSLMALGLVAGVLVDDAIVEIENIVRHMRMGKSAYQASIDAADEIGLAVVATTFSIVAVFLPVALMPGIAGQYFKVFGFTVVIAVLMSLAVARMITPMIAAYFLKAKGEADHASGPWIGQYVDILTWTLGRGRSEEIKARGGIFNRIYAKFFDHRIIIMGLGVLTFVVTIVMFIVIPKEFFPTGNEDFSRVNIEMVPGTTLEQTASVSAKVAEIIDAQPETQTALESIREGNGRIFITLKAERERKSSEYEEQLTPQLQAIPDARVSFLNNNGPGGGGTGRDFSIMLSGSDPALLERTAAILVEQMKGLKSVVGPRVNADLQRPEILITPRSDLASQLGVSTSALSQTIRIATLGEIDQNSAKFSLSDRQVPIRVVLPRKSRRDFSTIENLPVPIAGGGSVPLSRVADISFGSGPTTIQRYKQKRRIFVGADLAPGVVKGTAQAQIDKLPVMQDLPTGVSNAPFGADEWQQEMQTNFGIALMAGTLLVFAVLVLLYGRVMSPLVNMGSLLLAPLGGLIALVMVGQALSLPVFIGILLLFGIVAKNSILLIDFALEQMELGMRKREAIIEAGRKRAQPIVMTTVAMTAGMIPTAISLSGDSSWRAPMGTVVIGGLILSTVLTLLIVPAGFSLASGIEKRLGRLFRRHLLVDDGEGPEKSSEAEVQPAE
ncbi:efflux RND transporter permease subunit [Sphingorhabdus sp. Alg231-15]|uniref:efflux RND transporter permease subunit n=1 Tax=Sphingorhabdus sp. Alg231-15 TaxID=1922222 RepID=UPI000D55E032